MSIPKEEVRRIAALARLRFTEAEVAAMADDLEQILEYVRKLDDLDTSNIAPTTHVHGGDIAARPDSPVQRIDREEGLANAPDTDGVYFRVPKVIE